MPIFEKFAVGGRTDSEPVTLVEPGLIVIQFKTNTVAFEGDENARWAACQERLRWASTQINEDLLIAGQVPIHDANGVEIGAITHKSPPWLADSDFVRVTVDLQDIYKDFARRPNAMIPSIMALDLSAKEVGIWAEKASPASLDGAKNIDQIRQYSMLNASLTPASHNYLFVEGVSEAEVLAEGFAADAPQSVFVSVDPSMILDAKHILIRMEFDSITLTPSVCETDLGFEGKATVRVSREPAGESISTTLIMDDHMGTYELTLDDSLKTNFTQMPSSEVRAALFAMHDQPHRDEASPAR